VQPVELVYLIDFWVPPLEKAPLLPTVHRDEHAIRPKSIDFFRRPY
jgi:hypothetical protein